MSENMGRPILVTIFGVISAILGLIVLVFGILLLAKNSLPANVVEILEEAIKTLGISAGVAGTTYVIMGLVILLVGVGFLKGWSIFWYVGVAVWVLALILGLYALYKDMSAGASVTNSAIDFIISLILVLYLFAPKVRHHFLS